MNLLLDTHIWIWSLVEPERLTRRVASALTSTANTLWLSPISTWEATVLLERGRVRSAAGAGPTVERWLAAIPAREAPLTHEVALTSAQVDAVHRDPADRLLAATALVFDLTLVTADLHLIRSRRIPTLANR